jgi:hypothetical protein
MQNKQMFLKVCVLSGMSSMKTPDLRLRSTFLALHATSMLDKAKYLA